MTRKRSSGSGWLLFLATLQAVSAQDANAGVGGLGPARLTVNNVWMGADTITISLQPFNLSDHKIFVSVQQESNTSLIVVDKLPGQTTATKDVLMPIKHEVKELQPDTKYELCVSVSDQENSVPDTLQSECYKVKTFPKVDNVKGVYGALLAVGIFLVVCAVTWLLYKAFWVKYFTKVLKVEDSQEMEQQVEGQPASSPRQEVIISETEPTVSTITRTQ